MSEDQGGRSPVIRLQQVTKHFGDYVAVEVADFDIIEGEFFSMLGPSGCGKTTTLRMIAGFETPTSGAILLDGHDVSRVPPYKRDVNTVFQQYGLFPHMSVLDNVAFGLRSKKVAKVEARKQAQDMLDVVRLGDFAARKPAQLSGGQQQRVALARALVNKPKALLLDEPLGALDLKLRQSMQLELKRIQRDLGITFVFVTHDQEEALTMSDRIAVMTQGRTDQIGTPTDIYHHPATVFVAGFIGTANLLPVTVASQTGDVVAVDFDGFKADGPPLGRIGGVAQHFGGGAETLQTILVHVHKKIVQPVLQGKVRRFPGCAFVGFAVGQQGVGVAVLAAEFGRVGDARRNGQPVAQRTRSERNARILARSRVGGKGSAILIKGRQSIVADFAQIIQTSVKRSGGVALGKQESIVGIFIHQQNPDHQVDAAQRAADVSRVGLVVKAQDFQPQLTAELVWIGDFRENGLSHVVSWTANQPQKYGSFWVVGVGRGEILIWKHTRTIHTLLTGSCESEQS